MCVILERLTNSNLARDLYAAERIEDDTGHERCDRPCEENKWKRHDDASSLQTEKIVLVRMTMYTTCYLPRLTDRSMRPSPPT